MIGVDLVKAGRFKKLLKAQSAHLLHKLLTRQEIAYAKRYRDPSPHLAGLFAAKEAASKALGTNRYPLTTLEVRHSPLGAPEIWHRGRRAPVAVSIAHEEGTAVAVALRYEKMPRTRSR